MHPGLRLAGLVAAAVVGLSACSPASAAAGRGGLPAEMWERVQASQPARPSLATTPIVTAPAELSMRQCLELALANNAGYRANVASLVTSKRALWVADQRLFYSVDASTQQGRSVGGGDDDNARAGARARWQGLSGDSLLLDAVTGSQVDFGDVFSTRPSLSAAYERPLLRGAGLASSTAERVRSATVSDVAEQLSFYEARQALAVAVVASYYEALLAEGEVDIAQRQIERAQRQYDVTYAKYTGEGIVKPGEKWDSEVPEIDVGQARLRLEESKRGLIATRQGLQDAMDTLLLQLGCQAGATPKLTTAIAYQPQEYEETALSKQAQANSLRLARLHLAREDTEAARRLAYSASRPDLIASVGVTDAGETIGGISRSAGWFAGVRVEVPIGERGLAEGRDRTDRQLLVVDQNLIAEQEQVIQAMQRLVRAANTARERITIGEESVKLAQKSREQAQGMYEAGLVDLLRVLDADDSLVSAERSLLQEKVAYFLSTVRIRQALGEDLVQLLTAE